MADISYIKELAGRLNLSNVAKGKVKFDGKFNNHLEYLEDILLQELNLRQKNRIKKNKQESRLPNLKFDNARVIDGVKWQIKKILKLDFIKEDSNIIITGRCGVGKTSLAVDICSKAIEQGNIVIYYTQDEYLDIIKRKIQTEKESVL